MIYSNTALKGSTLQRARDGEARRQRHAAREEAARKAREAEMEKKRRKKE